MATPLLEMRKVRKRFGALEALRGVDLELYAGDVLALLGDNGAGKSTLMKILAGAIAPDEGEIFFKGEPVRRVGGALIVDRRRMYREARRALDDLHIAVHSLTTPIRFLSGGQRQS